jgi:hypothetical protein
MPSLPLANSQQALNHTVNGVRVRSKIVPAVVEVRARGSSSTRSGRPPAATRRRSHSRDGRTRRPTQPLQVVQTVAIGAEPRLELT